MRSPWVRIVSIALAVTLLSVLAAGCERAGPSAAYEPVRFTSYTDIPGVMADDIVRIDALREEYGGFVYGVLPSTVSFYDGNGEIRGFSALFCEWMTQLFGIPFRPEFVEWGEFLAKLASHEVDFTGAMTATEERMAVYSMTTPIATQMLMSYRIIGSEPLGVISQQRLPRYAFVAGTTTIDDVTDTLEDGSYELVLVSGTDEAYARLKSGEADVFFNVDTVQMAFDQYGDVVAKEYFPLIFSPVSLATQNPALRPVIDVLQKALDNGALQYLAGLYNQGHKEYLKNKLLNQLTNEERAFIRNNPVIPVASIYSNYPVSFYNAREREWQGIFFDLLDEIKTVIEIDFVLVNDEHTEWYAIQDILRSGEAQIVGELLWTRAREEHFIWTETVIQNDYYALISRADHPNITVNEIRHSKVGLARDTGYTAMFQLWFPDHEHSIEYDSIEETFLALGKGEVDLVMTTERRLMFLTHYQELAGYKLNYVFDQSISTRFGFHKDDEILKSIIDKALQSIDTKGITNQWMRRTFDYRAKVAEAQRPLFIGLSALLVCVLFLVAVLFGRSRRAGKRLEMLVGVRTQELELASRAKSEFLATMSHEIRTPMNSVIGFTELALGEMLTPKIKDYLDNILKNSEWLLQIINDILDISKIESGKMDLENVPFDLHELFDACRAMIAPKAEDKGILLHFYAEPSLGKVPLGDPTRLLQVLLNLLSNSVKFTNSGMIKVQSAIRDVSGRTVTMLFEVKDTGIGMTGEQIQKVLDPFMQAETGTTRKYGGTGLGLAITNNLIGMMGGDLEILSTPGVGSKFSFTLTFETIDADDSAVQEHKKAPINMNKPTFNGEILLFEDNAMNQQVITEHLARVGLVTVIAENGKVGVDMVAGRKQRNEKQFDLIFMDIHMPVMDGLEAAAKIKELETGIPVVAMTANIMSGDKELYRMNGMRDSVGKPFTSQELWRCLMKYFTPVHWQIEEGTQKIQADDKLRRQLVRRFVDIGKDTFQQITQAMQSGDTVLAHRLAHTLKSNAGQLGETALQQAAGTVEDSLADGMNRVTPQQISELRITLDAAIEKLAPMAGKPDAEPAEPMDPAAVHALLDELGVLLMDSDPESLSYVGRLRSIPGSRELIEQIEDFNFALAMESLARLDMARSFKYDREQGVQDDGHKQE